jgi:hypothetical protein
MKNKINCPNCSNEIDVNDLMAKKLNTEMQELISKERKQLEMIARKGREELKKRELDLQAKIENEEEIIESKLAKLKSSLSKKIEDKVKNQHRIKIESQQIELIEKTKELQELKVVEVELDRLKRESELQKKQIILDEKRKWLEKEKAIKNELTEKLKGEAELVIKEKDYMLEEQKKLIEVMKRKAEQGSMQIQGEIQELAIEDFLSKSFPLDSIREVRKGARGADCLQVINTRESTECGTIYYESKRTKEFQKGWVEKLKSDMRVIGADVGVIVTQTMPPGMKRLGEKSGVWICSYDEFKGLCHVLRSMLIQNHVAYQSTENKGDKMHMLYDFLTGNEFKMQIEAIVEGFTQMQTDLIKEKNAMMRIWNQREKQILKVVANTTQMYGSIRGIAGSSIPVVEQLELPGQKVFDL